MQHVSPGAPGWVRSVIFTVACGALFQAPLQARSLIHLDTIERDGYGVVQLKQPAGNEFMMEASLNSHPIRLILDTGALSHNITLSTACGKYLRVPPHPIKGTSFGITGKSIGPFTEGVADSFGLGNVQTSGTTLDFASFEFLHTRGIGGLVYTDGTLGNARRVDLYADGYLGLGFLQKCAAIIDIPNARLYLKPPGTGRTPQLGPALKAFGYLSADFDVTRSALIVDVSINGVSGKMVVDTGTDITIVDSRFAERAKLKSYRSGLHFKDAAGVESESTMADPASFKVGGVEVFRTKLDVEPTSFYTDSGGKIIGLLGMDFLGQSWGIIDFAQHKVYFTAVK
jgi:predicted aspartyl protease